MPFPTAFVMNDSGPDLGDGPVPEDGDRRRFSFPSAGLKPIADELRSMPPFGAPKGEGQHEQARRNTGGNARSQVDLLHGGTDAPVDRQGRWRDRSPLWLRGYMDGPASLATIPPLAALREARLNGLSGARAVVRRHGIGGSRRRVSDTSPTGWSGAVKASSIHVKPVPFFLADTGLAASPAPPRLRRPLFLGAIIRERSPRGRGWGSRGWCTLSADAPSRCGPAGRARWRGRGASASRPSGRPSAACPGPRAPRTCA